VREREVRERKVREGKVMEERCVKKELDEWIETKRPLQTGVEAASLCIWFFCQCWLPVPLNW
jgi:hypothetical protein